MYQVSLDDKQFPIAPSKIQMKMQNQNKTVTLINEGEINLLKMPGLTEISFEVLLPNQRYPFASYQDGYHDAKYYLDWLERLKAQAKSFPLKIVRQIGTNSKMDDFAMAVSLEEYTVTESVDLGMDTSVDIKLKQFNNYVTLKNAVTKPAEPGKPATLSVEPQRPAKTPGKSYTIKSGDSLWLIAKKELGNGARHGEIYQLNTAAIEAAAKQHNRLSSSSGHWIYPGTALSLPG